MKTAKEISNYVFSAEKKLRLLSLNYIVKNLEPFGNNQTLRTLQACFIAGYKAAQEEADSCDHILDATKMVDVNGWISVKDRVPEKEGEYLAFGYSASNAARWVVVMYDPRDECWYELSSDWDWTDDITHWQELPKPPKEEG